MIFTTKKTENVITENVITISSFYLYFKSLPQLYNNN